MKEQAVDNKDFSGEGTISGPGIKPAGKSKTPLLVAVFVVLVIITLLLYLR